MVQKLAIFADVQLILHLCWIADISSGCVRKSQNMCWRHLWMVPYLPNLWQKRHKSKRRRRQYILSCLLNLDSKSFVWTLGRVLTSWMICTKWLEVVRKSRDTGVNVSWVVEFAIFNWTIIRVILIWLILSLSVSPRNSPCEMIKQEEGKLIKSLFWCTKIVLFTFPYFK